MSRRRNRVVLRSEQRAPPTSGATSRQRVAAPLLKCMSATCEQGSAGEARACRGNQASERRANMMRLKGSFFEERAALGAKYQKLYEPLYTKRYNIVNRVVEVDGVAQEPTNENVAEGEIQMVYSPHHTISSDQGVESRQAWLCSVGFAQFPDDRAVWVVETPLPEKKSTTFATRRPPVHQEHEPYDDP
ncbi:hypothetical protein D1007_30563 [Hordeum vulgare]|nr:hypothetical protein D1007_30563 [Hordeum vulgare]